ncbi:FHA domain-containing protein [Pseudomaricurvus sp.]|uniref:FHA domain-containing protein n=1 Tax=Pseudomaricurvus sp. TaxID=2004510 RepID=UPI003F6C47C1
MLKLRFTNNKQNAVWLVEPKVTIGRSAACDLVIDHASIKDVHAEIRVNYEQLHFLLLNDSDTTFINGKPVPKGRLIILKPKYSIRIGDTELQVIDPKQESQSTPTIPRQIESTGWALKANHSALANRVFPVKAKTLVGRSNECDITLAAAHLSRRHAEMVVKDGLMYVKDLGSSNGTFVNGQRITEARIKRGDDLRFDTLSFGVIGPSDDLDKTTLRSVPKGGPRMAPARTPESGAGGKSQVPAGSREDTIRRHQSGSNRRPAAQAAAAVETIEPTSKSSSVGAVTGLLLLLVIGGGAYLAWQNGLI